MTTAIRTEQAVNMAADAVLEAINAPDEGVRDVVNLVVNAACFAAENGYVDLEAVVEGNYASEVNERITLAEVLDWCSR